MARLGKLHTLASLAAVNFHAVLATRFAISRVVLKQSRQLFIRGSFLSRPRIRLIEYPFPLLMAFRLTGTQRSIKIYNRGPKEQFIEP